MTNPDHNLKIAFTTLGCRVNQYDGQALLERSEGGGFLPVPFHEPADIYVINTCTVTAAADAEGRQWVRRAKANNPRSLVVVTGCLAQDRPEEMAALPGVDLVVGNQDKARLIERIQERLNKNGNPLLTIFPSPLMGEGGAEAPGEGGIWEGNYPSPRPLPQGERGRDKGEFFPTRDPWLGGISRFDGHRRAFLKVQDGCNFGCSFCLIPRVRGEMVSRPLRSILEEARRLADNGVKELVLAGIQLSSYGRDFGLKVPEPRLAPVVKELLRVPGIQRVRLSSYAVADFEESLLPMLGKGLCAHIHLPLQSGDPGTLKAMRRPYRLEEFREKVLRIRKAAPSAGITSDIIAGFPGETEEAFQNTLDRIQEFGFTDLHPFPYSDRPGTPGEAIGPKTPSSVLRKRMDALLSLKASCLESAARKAQGSRRRVIVERHGRDLQAGLTDEGLRLVFPQREGALGQEAWVRVSGFQDGFAQAEWMDAPNDVR